MITDAVPEAKVWTLALPFGIYPQERDLALRGSWDGLEYRYSGVFTVAGSRPRPLSASGSTRSRYLGSRVSRGAGTRTSAAATGCAT